MAKKQHTFQLEAVLEDGTPVTSQNFKEADRFEALDGSFTVSTDLGDKVIVIGKKGSYPLHKHKSQNIYSGTCNGFKVHVTLKKMVGTLRTWY